MWAPSKVPCAASGAHSEADLEVDGGLDEESDTVVDTMGLPGRWRDGWGCDPCTLSYSLIALKLGFLAWCTIAVTVDAIMPIDHKDGF